MRRVAFGENFATYQVGAVRVTALRDGWVDMPPSRLRQPGNQPFDELTPEIPLAEGKLRLSVNAFLVETSPDLILVDTGASNAWEPSMGRLPQALAEAGIAADRITRVALTHTHIDHINGLVRPDGSEGFPRLAHLWVPEAELDLFRAERRLARFHALATPFEAGHLLDGVLHVVAAPGHELGHSAFRVASGGDELLIWGDTVHVPSIQFARPELTWEFDADQEAARASRLRLLDWAAHDGRWIAGAHLDWPGVGQLKRDGDGFRFEPL